MGCCADGLILSSVACFSNLRLVAILADTGADYGQLEPRLIQDHQASPSAWSRWMLAVVGFSYRQVSQDRDSVSCRKTGDR